MRNIAGEIEGIAGRKLVRDAFNDQSHFTFENVNDLFLPMRMLWHTTSGGECGEHLIHRFAVCDRPARYSGTNFNRRVFWFHFEILRKSVSRASRCEPSPCRLHSQRSRFGVRWLDTALGTRDSFSQLEHQRNSKSVAK